MVQAGAVFNGIALLSLMSYFGWVRQSRWQVNQAEDCGSFYAGVIPFSLPVLPTELRSKKFTELKSNRLRSSPPYLQICAVMPWTSRDDALYAPS